MDSVYLSLQYTIKWGARSLGLKWNHSGPSKAVKLAVMRPTATNRADPMTLCAHKLAFDGGNERLKASVVIGGHLVGNVIISLVAILITLIRTADQCTVQGKMRRAMCA